MLNISDIMINGSGFIEINEYNEEIEQEIIEFCEKYNLVVELNENNLLYFFYVH